MRYCSLEDWLKELEREKSLETKFNQVLEDPANFDEIERIFLEEYKICDERLKRDIKFDPIAKSTRLKDVVKKASDSIFKEVLREEYDESKTIRYFGSLGKMRLVARFLYDELVNRTLKQLQWTNYDPRYPSFFENNLTKLFSFLRRKNDGSAFYKRYTSIPKTSLHEVIITQVHEDHHCIFPDSHIKLITEGGARHLQVYANERLAQKSGDVRFRYALRESVLDDLVSLYFDLCHKNKKTPKLSIAKVQRIISCIDYLPIYMRRCERYCILPDISHLNQFVLRRTELSSRRRPNEYAKGYVLFKLAERKHSLEEIQRKVYSGDLSVLLDEGLKQEEGK
jgi:ribonuclease BN (tRNA processing enzyme)